jgi:hypothetical protein
MYTNDVGVAVEVEVAMDVFVWVGCTVDVEVSVYVGMGVNVLKDAPGVRKNSSQEGGVRMAGSTGSISSWGMLVRKSLFGLSFDPISVFSSQRGEKRTASCPATITHRKPINIIRRIMIQSRRSCSRARCTAASMYGEANVNSCPRVRLFIVAGTLQPDTPAVCIDDATRNGQAQARATAFKLGLAG